MSSIDKERYEELKKARTFYKFTYRGLELDDLVAKKPDELAKLVTSRARRRFNRGLKRKSMSLIKKLRKNKKLAKVGEKPPAVRTHLRDMIVMPEMVGSVVAIYNGRQFQSVEVKGEMIGRYLAEFAITYRPVFHGRPGVAAIAARFIPIS
jgi:small subunit ribosomal protein S15e